LEEEEISINRIIEKYLEAMRSEVFTDYGKEFSQKIISSLSQGYLQGRKEPPLVQIIESIVNSVHDFNVKNHKTRFKLSTKAIFIHGNKSHVQFNYYENRTKPIELGDLIFIISVVYNNKKYFEKITINQFKRDKRKSKNISWSITNKEQLYLLSRFPTFIGVRGLIPKKDYDLPNYSGCLGSYGFLYKPGDFAFVSATRLDSFIGDRKTIKMRETYNLVNGRENHLFSWYPVFWETVWHIFGNCHFSHNVFNFVHEYLRMNIGEPVFSKIGIDNPRARDFLHELMLAIEYKARKEKSPEMLNFVKEFRRFSYVDSEGQNQSNEEVDFDYDGGEIGIIHTSIDLGE